MAHHHHRKPAVSPELALASDLFDKFCGAATLKTILNNYRNLCEIIHIKPTNYPQFYPKLKSKLCSWRAQALWNKFDKRANHKCYNRGKACPNTRVLIIGAGPCGLRAAIEAQLLGAKVVVIEKRDRISRNNVLHLWPFVIQDLRTLGAKKFFGKFCAGSIDHISIRQLQCILLKVALLLGVEIHEGVSFESLIPPSSNQEEERAGWRAKVTPEDHPVSQYEFDVLIGADGKRNTLEGFKRKEFRGKLAIAITANFINHHTEAEARVEEISGVAYIFNQKFFKDLRQATGIDLENIVYYKDDTHYFVMTAKKHSLLNKGVILNDYADTAKLLAIENISKEALMDYAREAADFSTGYKLPQLQFAVNHYGQPDVAMFDFTSMYAAENASRVLQEKGYKLLMCLVGDSLLEPFWPTGSGCARGFLSSMDACWAVRSWSSSSMNPLEVLAERESIYRLLNQTTPENLSRDISNYTLDPHSRYPNLNTRSVLPIQVKSLYSTDDPFTLEQCLKAPSTFVCDYSKKRRRKDTQIHHDVLLSWLKRQVGLYNDVYIEDLNKSFKDGLALCAIIHRYRPDLIDFHSLHSADVSTNNQLAFDILEKEYGILPVMTGAEMEKCEVPDGLTMLSYLTQVYDIFRGEIPYTHQRKMIQDDDDVLNLEPAAMINQGSSFKNSFGKLSQSQKLTLLSKISNSISRKRYRESRSPTVSNRGVDAQIPRKPKKRKSGSSAAFIDREVKEMQEVKKNPMEVNFSGRVKDIENKLKEGMKSEKKPKDLLRAIGKIEKTDWNIKEIEKKIEENKYGRGVQSSAAKVPKWNRQQFDDKITAVKKKLIDKDTTTDSKYSAVDNTLKRLEQKLRNGTALEQGQRGANKVSAMAAQLTTLNQQPDENLSTSRKGSRNVVISSQSGSEICHFCNKRVYLMERLSAEGRFFHRGCFRCEYCGISLRLGNYSFDREGKYGSRFYCTQHFGYPGVHRTKLKNRQYDYRTEVIVDEIKESDDLPKTPTVLNMKFANDSTDTPERVGFENLDIDKEDDGNISRNEMDEDEWTDHNFGTSANELASSDDVSDLSESEEEDNEDEFAQALDIPPLDNNESLEFTRRFSAASLPAPTLEAHRKNGRNLILNDDKIKINNDSDSSCSEESSHHISYQEFESEDESDTATGEKECKREGAKLREVRLKVPDRKNATDSGSDTEVASDEFSMSSDDDDEYDEDSDDSDSDSDSDSATEISTDSEFERNNSTVIKSEIPDIVISESLPIRRGHLEEVKTIQIVSKNLAEKNVTHLKEDAKGTKIPSEERTNEVHKTMVSRLAFVNTHRGDYYLNRTQSTEGVASKISLELKKKYLLGNDSTTNLVKKSESTSVLDTKFKSLVDQISEHQKLLNPARDPKLTMQTFTRNNCVSPTTMNFRKSKELTGLEDFQHVCSQSDNFESVNGTMETWKNESGSKDSQAETDTSHTNSKTLVEERPSSPIYETSIVVPEFRVKETAEPSAVDVTSTSDPSSADEYENEFHKSYRKTSNAQISLPKVEIHNSQGELLPQDVDVEEKDSVSKRSHNVNDAQNCKTVCSRDDSSTILPVHAAVVATASDGDKLLEEKDDSMWSKRDSNKDVSSKIMAMPVCGDRNVKDREVAQILRHVSTPSELFVSSDLKRNESRTSFSDKSSPSTPTSVHGDDNTLAVFTETELSDWARDEDGVVSENFDDLILGTTNITYKRHQKPKKRGGVNRKATAKTGKGKDIKHNEFVHVCGKAEKQEPPSFILADVDNMDIEFMDTGEDEAYDESVGVINPMLVKNSGYIEYVTSEDEAKTPLAEAVNSNYPTFADYGVSGFALREDITKNNYINRDSFTSLYKDDSYQSDENLNNARLEISEMPEETIIEHGDDFDNFVHRLQDRISPFGNVKDSIDVRKSRKIAKSPIISEINTANIVAEEDSAKNQIKTSPSRKLEELSRERSKQKNLIHEMVMSKLQSEGKMIQIRKAKRNSRNSASPFNSSSQNSLQSQLSDESRKNDTRFTKLKECEEKENDVKDSEGGFDMNDGAYLSLNACNKNISEEWIPSSLPVIACDAKYAESFSLPDIRKALCDAGDDIMAPVTPSAAKLEILKSTESIRQQARTRARLMSDSELGLSPEEKLKLLKQKIAARKAVQSAFVDYPKSEDYLDEKATFSSKVLDELQSAITQANCKSTNEEHISLPRSKSSKDKDRRKTIIQAVSDFFLKKSPVKSPSSKDSPSSNKIKFKISLMGKEKSKSADDVITLFTERRNDKNLSDDTHQQNYLSECDIKRKTAEGSAPPRPPSPVSYTPNLEKSDENISITTIDSKDENSLLSTSKHLRSSNRKTKRENQKKLRMAQEIQRQLEEIEVKQKELEFKGVKVEKALRNKNQNSESEFELMQELLDMIRERNELRKYEQKLLLKAKEIEAEDPY